MIDTAPPQLPSPGDRLAEEAAGAQVQAGRAAERAEVDPGLAEPLHEPRGVAAAAHHPDVAGPSAEQADEGRDQVRVVVVDEHHVDIPAPQAVLVGQCVERRATASRSS